MLEHDMNVRAIKISRPRESLVCQYTEPLHVHAFLEQLARAKKMRRQGFVLHRAMRETPESAFYLTWTKEKRGGKGGDGPGEKGERGRERSCKDGGQGERSLSPTVTYCPTVSPDTRHSDMVQAQQALNWLEDTLARVQMANWYLATMSRRERPVKIVALADLYPNQESRGGMWRRQEDKSHEKPGPSKWESRQQVQGLQVHSSIQAGKIDLPCLGAEDFAPEAHGYALVSWETWTKASAVRSQKGLLALLPGDKLKQANAVLGDDGNRVVLKELVLQVPESGRQDGGRRFAKLVTMVNHTVDPSTPVYEVKHKSEEVHLTMAYESLILLDLFTDMAPASQDWSSGGVKLTFEGALAAWKTKGNYMAQWATLRHDRDGQKSTVSVRCDPEARAHLLHSSGLGAIVFDREHPAFKGRVGVCACLDSPDSREGAKPDRHG